MDYIISYLASGTSEAFLHAVATESQLKRSNDSLLLFSLIYLVLNVILIKLAGAVGLILANALSILSMFVVLVYGNQLQLYSYMILHILFILPESSRLELRFSVFYLLIKAIMMPEESSPLI